MKLHTTREERENIARHGSDQIVCAEVAQDALILEDELARVREAMRLLDATVINVVRKNNKLREELDSAREVIALVELAWGDMDPLLHSTTMLTVPLVRHMEKFGDVDD